MSKADDAVAIADAAVDEARLREKALTMAVCHFKKINFSGDPKRIITLADAFLVFLKGG